MTTDRPAIDRPATDPGPFHAGERDIQARYGLAHKMEQIGRKVIRPVMPLQHQVFFMQLPSFFLGWQDGNGRPWASVLTGAPGFLSAPNDSLLRVDALPAADDPLRAHLAVGAKVGGLGLEFQTRRRNRLNGTVTALDAAGFTIGVEQSFGNCPQYIQTRDLVPAENAGREIAVESFGTLAAADIALIERADTFFIASHAGPAEGAVSQGADVSHRGGKSGFVRVTADGVLEFPDYAGNRQFQTLGNIRTTGRAGLLFIDFEADDLLRLTGDAEIVFEGPQVDAVPGAERLVRLRPVAGSRVRGGMPLAWKFDAYSPVLERLGP